MRDGGKRHPQEVVTLGDPSVMTPHEARAAAERMKGIVRSGENPKDVLAAETQAASERKATKALGEWLQAYTERHLTPTSKHNASERRNAAGALADRGDLKGAIGLLEQGWKQPKRAKDHHLSRAYALADLYERAGRTARARDLFSWITRQPGHFADAPKRLNALS